MDFKLRILLIFISKWEIEENFSCQIVPLSFQAKPHTLRYATEYFLIWRNMSLQQVGFARRIVSRDAAADEAEEKERQRHLTVGMIFITDPVRPSIKWLNAQSYSEDYGTWLWKVNDSRTGATAAERIITIPYEEEILITDPLRRATMLFEPPKHH
jgi:hypothetical protein